MAITGNSTFTLRSVLDGLIGRGMKDPMKQPAGIGLTLTLELANDAMADFICERFNWKWNSVFANSFLTLKKHTRSLFHQLIYHSW